MPEDAPIQDEAPRFPEDFPASAAADVEAEIRVRRTLAEPPHLTSNVATFRGFTAVDDRGNFGLMTLHVEVERYPAEPAYVRVSERDVCDLLRVTPLEAEQLAAALLVAAQAARRMDAIALGDEDPP